METPEMATNDLSSTNVSITDFQNLIREMYYAKDAARGVAGTFMWLMEEVGELSSALRETSLEETCSTQSNSTQSNSTQSNLDAAQHAQRRKNLQAEFADVLAWLATIANVVEIDLNQAVKEKYGSGCPGCQQFICVCPDAEKP